MGVISENGHWPKFNEVLCGDMTDRERLGLPSHYVEDRFANDQAALYKQFHKYDTESLVAITCAVDQSLIARYVAGNILALVGDPRVSTFAPPMLTIQGGLISIGLNSDDVSTVLKNFDMLGLNTTWVEKECPRHQAHLTTFRIAKYPVTNQEYREFLIDTGYQELPDSWAFRRFPVERANHPVYTLPAEACDAYASWLAVKTSRGFRLPTEEEWEYAAAGAEGREFPWGEMFDPMLANTCETGIFNTTPVGIFINGASIFGVLDMAGNVEEYVSNVYKPYPGGEKIDDHLSQIHGLYRVARGGSFARFRDLARNRRRHGHNPRSVTYAMGFRLAETI
jgi:formylglycine-generating enzyme required for sulfatase activity